MQTVMDVLAGICVLVSVFSLFTKSIDHHDTTNWLILAALLHFWIK